MKELDLRFHDKKRVVSNGPSPGVDSRFNRDKAKRMHKTDKIFVENVKDSVEEISENVVVVDPVVVDPEEWEKPTMDRISIEGEVQKPKRPRKQKEEINADNIDI